MRLTTVTRRADLLLLTAGDFDDVPHPLGTVRLPQAFSPNRAEYRRDVARALNNARLEPAAARSRKPASSGPHPVESDPELRQRMRASRTDRTARARARRAQRPRRRPRPIAGARVRPRARRARSSRLRRRARLVADRARPDPRRASSTSPTCSSPSASWPARSTASARPTSPACCRCSSTSTARPSRHRRRGSRRPTCASGGGGSAPSARTSPPTSARPASPSIALRIPDSSERHTRGSPATELAAGRRRRGRHRRRLRAHDEAAHRPRPPDRPGRAATPAGGRRRSQPFAASSPTASFPDDTHGVPRPRRPSLAVRSLAPLARSSHG